MRTVPTWALVFHWAFLLAEPSPLADTSACAQQAAPVDAAAMLKAYRCPTGDAEATAARLRAEFRNSPSVRIVAESRSGQIIVQAPPAIQSQIAQRLAAASPTGSVLPSRPLPPSSPPIASFDPNTSQSVSVPLQSTTTRQIEEGLVAVLGKRLTPVSPAELGARSYQLTLLSGGAVRLDLQQQINRVTVQGNSTDVEPCVRLVQALDAPPPTAERTTSVVSLRYTNAASARRTVEAIRTSSTGKPPRGPMVTALFQEPGESGEKVPSADIRAGQPPVAKEKEGAKEGGKEPAKDGAKEGTKEDAEPVVPTPGAKTEKLPESTGLIGPVQIEYVEGLDILLIRGHEKDVKRVREIINEIERLSTVTEPVIDVHFLRHIDSQAVMELIIPLYDEIFLMRRGDVSITALVKPNALLLIGRRENVQIILDLLRRLDKPVAPDTQFQVFRLRNAAAAMAAATVQDFFFGRFGLGTRVRVTADYRSNALIVQACPRDMAEVADLIARIDTSTSEAVHELRVFKLNNSLADEMVYILQAAMTGQAAARAPAVPGVPGAQPGLAAGGDQKSTMLRFVTIDTKGQRRLSSGILTDVRISADSRANAVLVSAPAESMELIAALIYQLDTLPPAEAQIKVFTIVNSDAATLADMLNSLFVRQYTPGQILTQMAGTQGESMLIQLRFAVDMRTNSIIASGSMGDLQVVEAILLRLDESDVRRRRSIVYRLKNAPANDVANAITQFLSQEQSAQQFSAGTITAEQIERQVVVVPEPVSNSLIVSATLRYYDEIKRIVEELDARPPMVMIQVLIAEVTLNNADEFGIELGLQDSVLFDRSLLGNVITTTSTTFNSLGNAASENQQIVSATYTPGFGFNNQPLGQSSDPATANRVGTQGISNFSLQRTNNELGYGGFVFSASSGNVSVLIRALQECRRLEILSRPQVMTLDNQPAFIQVGQRVPRVTGTSTTTTGQNFAVAMENVGLILGVTPRISPDGLVVMAIDAEKSEVGPEIEGIPVSISATGQVIRQPRINLTMAQTTVSAISGQTVVLGGLITKSKSEFHRKVPWLGDIPLVGRLFRYDGTVGKKTELLIIMTPHIVRNEADIDAIKRTESARMHWCLADVLALHGKNDPRARTEDWGEGETAVIYPDLDPSAQMKSMPNGRSGGPEIIPVPNGKSGAGPMMPGGQQPTTPNNGLPPGRAPAPLPLEEPPAEPKSPSAAEGARGLPPPAPSEGTQLRFRPAGQSADRGPPYFGGAQPAVYQGPAPPPAQFPQGYGPVVPAVHNGPPQYQPPPR